MRKNRPWLAEDDATIRALYQTHSAREIGEQLARSTGAVFQRANDLGLRKTRDWIADRARLAMQNPAHGGHAHQFKPGLSPWNKGTHFHAGGRSVETQFKPGTLQGRALSLRHEIGALRINADGYLDRKINDDLPMHKRWRAEHTLVWEAANGPLPAGCAIVFKDGDKTHITLDNLECITRSELMKRNTLHRHGKEIAQLVQLRGALQRQINRRANGNQPATGETP